MLEPDKIYNIDFNYIKPLLRQPRTPADHCINERRRLLSHRPMAFLDLYGEVYNGGLFTVYLLPIHTVITKELNRFFFETKNTENTLITITDDWQRKSNPEVFKTSSFYSSLKPYGSFSVLFSLNITSLNNIINKYANLVFKDRT